MEIRRHLVRRVGPQVLASVVVVPALIGLLIHLAPTEPGILRFEPPPQDSLRSGRFVCDGRRVNDAPYLYPGASPGGAVEPGTDPAVLGQPFCFAVGHCGLHWLTDFDGSFWAVTSWDPSPHPELGENDDWLSILVNGGYGSMRLVGLDEAEYGDRRPVHIDEGSEMRFEERVGPTIHLERIDGPIVPFVCY